MHDAFGMGGIQSVGHFNRDGKQSFEVNWASADHMLQRPTLEEFHHHEGAALFFFDVVNGADVGMDQSGSRLRFALEPGQSLRIAGHFVRKKFERDETVKARVFGFVHNTHSTTAEFLQDATVRNGLADHRPESYVDEMLEVN
jgi:hypothetical protein